MGNVFSGLGLLQPPPPYTPTCIPMTLYSLVLRTSANFRPISQKYELKQCAISLLCVRRTPFLFISVILLLLLLFGNKVTLCVTGSEVHPFGPFLPKHPFYRDKMTPFSLWLTFLPHNFVSCTLLLKYFHCKPSCKLNICMFFFVHSTSCLILVAFN